MQDTLESLKRELAALGPVDYSTQTRQLREMILGQIANFSASNVQRQKNAEREALAFFVDAVNNAYNENSIYGSQAPYKLTEEAKAYGAGDKAEAITLALDYLVRYPE